MNPIDRLSSPIPFPDLTGIEDINKDRIAKLENLASVYGQIASVSKLAPWPQIRNAVQEVINHYTLSLINAKGEDVIRLQEKIKSFKFFLELPASAEATLKNINDAISSLRPGMGLR